MREVETIKQINLKTENLKIVSIPSGVRRVFKLQNQAKTLFSPLSTPLKLIYI